MAMFNFDMSAFYAKALVDHSDDVRANGGITETAPFVGIADGLGGGAAPIGWGTVHPVLLSELYQYYGNKRLIAEHYPTTVKWVQFLDTQAPGGFIETGLGDHETLAPKVVPLTSTAFYYMNAELQTRLARILGNKADADVSTGRAAGIKAAFNRKFLDSATGKYATGTQACQAFAMFLGLVPPADRDKVIQALLSDITANKNHLTTGIFGTRFMLMALSAAGHADVVYRIVNQRDFPGWGHMLEKGATTLWEHWEFSDNTYSHNHPMFGSVSEWFFKVLAGIRPADEAVGFSHIVIRPAIIPELGWVKARHDTIRGTIVSEWSLEGNVLKMHVVIPPNTKAVIHLPTADTKDVTEGVRRVQQAQGLRLISMEAGHTLFQAASGDYQFTIPWPPKKMPPSIK
jgi:alpha-L-rhamnosidase